MTAHVRSAPITVPTLLAVGLFLAWVPFDGGQPLTTWVPGALAVLGLLAVAAVALPGGWRTAPPAVRVAVAALGAYAAWSYASLLWADDQGAALEGANRTLLYVAGFALFALWPQRTGTAGAVLGVWTLGMGVLSVVTLVRIGAVDDPTALFDGQRLSDPAGYPNAAAALWLMAAWPALTLAAGRRVPWALRGAFAALAVVLVEAALLSQSRGSALSVGVCAVVFVALVPGRLRHLALLVPVAIAVAAAAPTALDVGPAMVDGASAGAADAVVRAVLLAAVAAGVIVAAAALLEVKRPPSAATAARMRRAWAITVVTGGVVLGAGGLVAVGGPVTPLRDAWHSFKGGYEDNGSGNRLVSGLGSDRYDFYRVAVDVFAEHPVLGVGADNFFQDYLQRGDGVETPRNPHSIPLRTLEQTGVIGALLLLAALGAALVAAWRGMRLAGDALAGPAAGGAAMAFVYWLVHGTTDWFWEWAGLGAPAFALLGLAAALAPRRARTPAPAPTGPSRFVGPVLGGVALVAAAVVIAGPWLAERDIVEAAAVFAQRPHEAYARLERAADLDPFADRPYLVEGSIALRFGDLARAQRAFENALERNPRGQYATLELGAIASVRGRRAEARRLLGRALALAPRDQSSREALDVVKRGGTVDLTVLNRRILEVGQSFGSD